MKEWQFLRWGRKKWGSSLPPTNKGSRISAPHTKQVGNGKQWFNPREALEGRAQGPCQLESRSFHSLIGMQTLERVPRGPRHTLATWIQCSNLRARSWAVLDKSPTQVVRTVFTNLSNWATTSWTVEALYAPFSFRWHRLEPRHCSGISI